MNKKKRPDSSVPIPMVYRPRIGMETAPEKELVTAPTFDDLPPLPPIADVVEVEADPADKKDKIVAELRKKGERMAMSATQRRAESLREWGAVLKEYLSMDTAIRGMRKSIEDLELAQATLVSRLSPDATRIAFEEWVVMGESAHKMDSSRNGGKIVSMPLTQIPEPTHVEAETYDLEKEYM